MNALSLNVISELANLDMQKLRTRFRKAVSEYEEVNGRDLLRLSRGHMMLKILKYEFDAVELMTEESEEEQEL